MSEYGTTNRGWKALGTPSPDRLERARLELHYAAQPLAAAASAHAFRRPDDSHTSLSWDPTSETFLGAVLPGDLRVALSFQEPSLRIVAGDGTVRDALLLPDRTLHDALEWLRTSLPAASEGAVPDRPLEIPTYDLPAHAVAEGAKFTSEDGPERAELARWFGNLHPVLSVLSQGTPGASPVRCWPHHFDMATLITLDPPGGDPETARSVGVGFSPGDGGSKTPYIYCNPWPAAAPDTLPKLAGGGSWHRAGWFGAVLDAGTVVQGDAGAQSKRVTAFVDSAVAANRRLLQAH